MKITFFRKGHANNSSSSHSLIFSNDSKSFRNTKSSEFGWDYFTASSLEAKKNYIYCCLEQSFGRSVNISSSYNKDIDYGEVERFRQNCFLTWLNVHFSEFEFECPEENSYVDHQSVFYFPTYRDKTKGINKQLAKSVIKEFLRPEYVVLGGNDNDDRSHPLADSSDTDIQFIKFWKFCVDAPELNKAEYDDKTEEFVVSLGGRNGSLMKIKF
jgi:hypothetical protein